MPGWPIRIALNSVKAIVPFQPALRQAKHSLWPPELGRHHELVLDGILEQIAFINNCGGRILGARMLEIGSGWIPVAPLIYRLAGAAEVLLSDQHRLLHRISVLAAVSFIRSQADRLSEALGIDPQALIAKLEVPEDGTLNEMLDALGLAYIVPLDAGSLDGKIDLAYSHTVLEHIPPAALADIFLLVREKLVVGGIFCNGIDNSDHRKLYDDDLSLVDFLKYSEFAWKLQCLNPQDYTNRLRHSDYVAMLNQAGFEIVDSQVFVASAHIAEIEARDLPKAFGGKSSTDLCTTWSLILARASACE